MFLNSIDSSITAYYTTWNIIIILIQNISQRQTTLRRTSQSMYAEVSRCKEGTVSEQLKMTNWVARRSLERKIIGKYTCNNIIVLRVSWLLYGLVSLSLEIHAICNLVTELLSCFNKLQMLAPVSAVSSH